MALASSLYLVTVVCGFVAFMAAVAYAWLTTNPPWRRVEAPKVIAIEARRPDAHAAKHAA